MVYVDVVHPEDYLFMRLRSYGTVHIEGHAAQAQQKETAMQCTKHDMTCTCSTVVLSKSLTFVAITVFAYDQTDAEEID
jgi:hypothetical protein